MPKAEGFVYIETYNFEELAERLGKSREYMLVALNEGLREAGRLLTPQIKEETPEGATGKLKRSTVFQVLGKAEDMRMEIRQSAFSEGGFPYGAAVRTGTRPHFPPIQALVPWVIKVLHIPEERSRQVAFLVARKISRVGTPPNPYHIRVFEANTGQIQSIMEKSMLAFVARIGDVPKVRI